MKKTHRKVIYLAMPENKKGGGVSNNMNKFEREM